MAPREPMQAEIAAFLEAQPRTLTYSALAAALAARFGDAAWDAETIRAYFLRSDRLKPGRDRLSQEPEVRAFVLDRIGRQTGDEILAALRLAFRPERTPSRSALYRFIGQETARHAVEGVRQGLRRAAAPGAAAHSD